MARSQRVKEAITAILNPIRRNTLKERRRRLGLSRMALARILDVDPASVYRHELNPMTALWDYALRGVEAEAARKDARSVVRSFKLDLDLQAEKIEQIDALGHKVTAERMRASARGHAKKPSPKPRPAEPRKMRSLPQSAINAAVERAESRSAAGRKA